MNRKEEVLKILKEVLDPELGKDVVSLGMIQNLDVKDGNVSFKLLFTTPACPIKDSLKENLLQKVRSLSWVKNVDITLDAKVREKETQKKITGVKNIIVVLSGKGGVGKSTVALNLAFALKEMGAKTGLLDADIYGPTLSKMAGAQGRIIAQGNKMVPLEKDGVKIMSIGFLTEKDAPVIWRGPLIHSAIRQMLFDVHWLPLDYLIMDLPPGTGDPLLSTIQLVDLAGGIVVTTPQDISIYDVRRACNMLKKLNVPIIGIVENMSHFICPECKTKHNIFGKSLVSEFAMEMESPVLGKIPFSSEFVLSGDKGEIPIYDREKESSLIFFEIAKRIAGRISQLLYE